jgi:multiple sugar transport system permease protein
MKNKPSSYSPGLAAYLFKKKVFKIVQSIFLFSIIAGLCFTILYPLIQLVPSLFSSIDDLGNPNVIWVPAHFSIVSFKAAIRFSMPDGWLTMLGTILYAAGIMVIQVFMSAMAGYALARVKFFGNKIVFFLVILVFLIPRQSLLLAQYIYFTHFNAFGILKLFTAAGEINMINNPVTLVLIAVLGFGVQQSLFIFIFSQFFKNIPNELEEAALIDGCGFHKTYFKIMIPNAIPAISTVGILSFVWNYGDTYYTSYFNKDGPYLASILATKFADNNKEFVINAVKVWFDVPLANDFAFDAIKQAAVIFFLIPLLVVYFGAQKWLVENLENSGLVG